MINRRHVFVYAVVVISLALRLFIVGRGGDYYWADETRFQAARRACEQLTLGHPRAALDVMFSTAGHVGFRWMALVPAFAERMIYGGDPPNAQVCAGFFALFGVANLVLVWLIARRVSGSEREAALALAFAASSNALFYYARHCFPYDVALTFFLLSVYVSVGAIRSRQSFLVGACCGIGYLTYNGYWSVGAVVMMLDVFWRRDGGGARAARAVAGLIGLLAPIAIMFGAAQLAGHNLVADARAFAGTVNQGDFGDGWRFPFEYLAVADGGLAAGLAGFVLMGTILCGVRRDPQPWLRWVVAVVSLYAIWVLFCDVIPAFVLYGRTVRAAVPFLALAAAGSIELISRLVAAKWRVPILAAASIICVCGLGMMLVPLRQIFPREFRTLAQSVTAKVLKRDPNAAVQVLYAEYLSSPNFPEEPPPHRELLRRAHPHRYPPYMYEGYTRGQRPLYLGHDIAMRLIQLDTSRGLHLLKRAPASRALAPYPGPLSLFVRFPKNATGTTEDLLWHGRDAVQSERLLIHYVDSDHIQLGFKHGDAPPRMSNRLACDYDHDHAIAISFGSFYPLLDDERSILMSQTKPLRDRVIVTLDGQTVLTGSATFQPLPFTDLRIGFEGAISGTGSPPTGIFSGTVYSVRQTDLRRFADLQSQGRQSAFRVEGPFFAEFYGVLEMQVRFPANPPPGSEPLLASGKSGAGDMLLVSYGGNGSVRFHVDHWGYGPIQSDPITIDPGAVQRIIVSFGSLFPPRDHDRYKENLYLRPLAKWLFVSVNDYVVFWRPFDFHRADPDAVSFGENLPGGTTAAPRFTGEILQVRRVPPANAIPHDADFTKSTLTTR